MKGTLSLFAMMVTLPGESWHTAGGVTGNGGEPGGAENDGLPVCDWLGISWHSVVANVGATDDLAAVAARLKPWSP
jgi:hypothetical protein